jgi:hypothetical protein
VSVYTPYLKHAPTERKIRNQEERERKRRAYALRGIPVVSSPEPLEVLQKREQPERKVFRGACVTCYCIAPLKSYLTAYSTSGQELLVGLAAAEIGGAMVHGSLQLAIAPPAFPRGMPVFSACRAVRCGFA